MESGKLGNPIIVEVVGLPGSGKSFFASQFAKTFHAAVVSIDKIRWTLFAHHTYSDNENVMVQQVADLIITELLKTGRTFVLDGGYNTKDAREEIQKRAEKVGFQILTVVVQVDELTAKRRATKRSAKNPGDRHKQSLSADAFTMHSQEYEVPPVNKNTVVISGKHTYSAQARTVLKKILENKDGSISTKTMSRPTPILRGRGGPFVQ